MIFVTGWAVETAKRSMPLFFALKEHPLFQLKPPMGCQHLSHGDPLLSQEFDLLIIQDDALPQQQLECLVLLLPAKTRLMLLGHQPRMTVLNRLIGHNFYGWLGGYERQRDLNRLAASLANGELWLPRSLASEMLKLALNPESKPPETGKAPSLWECLTEREREISENVVKGFSNKEIAKQLTISERTVHTHLASVFHKLGIHRRTQLSRLLQIQRPDLG
ncbi:response regulator transcription factor [Ferrimonas gelatinilytica]|uniref:HTH luxR-type domain-containing protein n=1 Tax=Ferrimonas gelatinilytica TaxID=1255257 RepID=A0ABP9S016_9GAMM